MSGGSVPDDWLVLVWSLVLLVSCLSLNIAALLLLLRYVREGDRN